MGYTHHFTQTRDFTDAEWAEVTTDIAAILKYAQHVAGIPLANGAGKPRTAPEINQHYIQFNGVGKNSYETFGINRQRADDGHDFCKTEHKPYDVAVVACLCYLTTIPDPVGFTATSDGHGHKFLDGLDLARNALPNKANMLDIPMGVMQNDRWTGPWVNTAWGKSGYDVNFCVDGKGYVLNNKGDSYCFATHRDLALFLDQNKVARFRKGGTSIFGSYGFVEPDIWNATGSFDEARHARIGRAQKKVLGKLFPAPAEHATQPPAYVRPDEFPRPEQNGTFHYYIADLIADLQKVA